MVKLVKAVKEMYNVLEKEVIAVELADKKGFKEMWQKIVDDFDEGESPQAILAKKMGWPKDEEAQKFAIESLKTDLIQRMDMPLSAQRFMPFYLSHTQESEYDRKTKKWSKSFPVVRGAAIAVDEIEEGYKLAILTAKRDSSKIARSELEEGVTYDGSFIDWTGASESDVLGLAVAENSSFNKADDKIDVDPVEWLREQYERVMVKDARKNFTDTDDPLDYVLVEGTVVSSRIKSYKGSDNRDGILTITDESISLLDMREAQKKGVRTLINVKTVSPLEITRIGKDSTIQVLGPLKDADQMKEGSEDEVDRSWNPQLNARALNIIKLVEREEEEEEPDSEEEVAEDAGDVYAEAHARKFDDDDEEDEDETEAEGEEDDAESETEEPEEDDAEPEEDESFCDEFGTGYDSDDTDCKECDDAEECEAKTNPPKRKKKGKKKGKK